MTDGAQPKPKPKPKLKTTNVSPRRDEMVKPGEIIGIPGMEGWSLADRRTWNMLLVNAWGDRLEDPAAVFEIPLRELRGLHESNDRVRESLEKLQTTLVKARLPDGNVRTVQMLGGTDLDGKDRVDGILRYEFSKMLVPVLRESEIYARMQLKILAAFTSKFSVALYEAIALRVNMDRSSEELSIPTLRQWLGVEHGKLTPWGNLLKFAISPAVREVNELSPYTIEIEPIKRGKKVDRVRVTWGKKEPFSPAEQAAAREVNRAKPGRKARLKGTVETVLPTLTEAEIEKGYAAAAKMGVRLDKHAMYEDWRRLVVTFPEPPANPVANFIAFCKEQARMLR
jgi:hypothetical protein